MGLNAKRPTPRAESAEKVKRDLAGQGCRNMKRLNVIVDENQLKQMKARALEEGKTVSEITRDLWFEYISK